MENDCVNSIVSRNRCTIYIDKYQLIFILLNDMRMDNYTSNKNHVKTKERRD